MKGSCENPTVLPGRDLVADMYFNFPQEVPKYLRGYYNIPSSLIGKMGALIFIANYGQNKELIKRIDKDNLEKLMPQGHKVAFFCFTNDNLVV